MRLDVFLVQKNLASSRTQAQEFVSGGYVFLNRRGERTALKKPSFEVTDEISELITVEQNPLQKYVSRGGLKLEAALKTLSISVAGKSALDIGQSTGGFSDCLLQAGAEKIVGVDVGHSQLHETLKSDKIIAFENLNVKDLESNANFKRAVPAGLFDLLVMDVSFISVTKVIPHVWPYLAAGGEYLILVKPQFECGRENLDKNGIVKNPGVYAQIENDVKECAQQYFKNVSAYLESELPGKDGNLEFLAVLLIAGCAAKPVSAPHEGGKSVPPAAAPPAEAAKTEPTVSSPVIAPAPSGKALPKIGIIFSGGGAKAWAHIGVIKEFEKAKWPVFATAGFEWGAAVAALYANNLSSSEVEWELGKLKDVDDLDEVSKVLFSNKSVSDFKVPFVCPSLNIAKQTVFLLNRGQMSKLLPFCLAHEPLSKPYGQSVAEMSDIASLAQHLRATGANKIVLINVLASQSKRSFTPDYLAADNILWAQSAAVMSKKIAFVDEIISINLDDYAIKDIDKKREIMAKGAELGYDDVKKLTRKFGL